MGSDGDGLGWIDSRLGTWLLLALAVPWSLRAMAVIRGFTFAP